MPDLKQIQYQATGHSIDVNEMGMREMQARAYEKRNAQYLLIKSPPASGKSRALMFIALDKLRNQGIKKVIVAVPEKTIGGSFSNTDLINHGFFDNWQVNSKYNLCTNENNKKKIKVFLDFLRSEESILICTHSTLRSAFQDIKLEVFNNVLLAIDEFHHVSTDTASVLGELIRTVMSQSTAHVVAMTGTYFRGDCAPVLHSEDEELFEKVTYNYYEQLNGYRYLRSLIIGFHFYHGVYTSAIEEVLDTDKKTILHIPHIMSGESTKRKHREVDEILDVIGTISKKDPDSGVIFLIRHSDGKDLKVADLVWDRAQDREKIVNYLRNMTDVDDMDLIIALGMAKEGFDWPYCEHALTVGYRGSLTEIIQIIGRCTRDSSNKTQARFTNLVALPDSSDENLVVAVNNMLKAITCSLLMEQVLVPNLTFKAKKENDKNIDSEIIYIQNYIEPTSNKVKKIIENDINDLKASILQDETLLKTFTGTVDPEVINKLLIPRIIENKYPYLTPEEIEQLRQYVVTDSVFKNNEIKMEKKSAIY